MGLVNYYGVFIPRLATVAAPLHQLMKKDRRWTWGEEEEKAWRKIKKLLSSAEVLCHYNPVLPIRLACDASSFGVAAVLSHLMPDGGERPVAYASKSLSDAEKNYSQLDKEALAIVFGVRRFHQYLYGRKFTLITDHRPLLSILGPKSGVPLLAAARLQRWSLILSTYRYELEFQRTTEHGNADALSRFPMRSKKKASPGLAAEEVYHTEFFSATISAEDVKRETEKDPELVTVRSRLHW